MRSKYRPVKMVAIHLRIPGEVLAFCHLEADKLGIPQQEYIRGVLEEWMDKQQRLAVVQERYAGKAGKAPSRDGGTGREGTA